MADNHKRYGGAKWRATTAAVKDRDGHACQQCGHPGTPDNPLTVDHIIPLSTFSEEDWTDERQFDQDNLTTLCNRCNGRKQNRTAVRQTWFNRRWLSSV